ncbi:MAG: hypothetical protein RJB11_1684 [Planctomycetota bacterium]|jgi:hypothetical protein
MVIFEKNFKNFFHRQTAIPNPIPASALSLLCIALKRYAQRELWDPRCFMLINDKRA